MDLLEIWQNKDKLKGDKSQDQKYPSFRRAILLLCINSHRWPHGILVLHKLCHGGYKKGIRGAVHDILIRFLGFVFNRKLVFTKRHNKLSNHKRRASFFQDLVFCTHQQKWRQICCILYTIFSLLTNNLYQHPSYTHSSRRDTDSVAAVTIKCMFLWGGHCHYCWHCWYCIWYDEASPLNLSDISQQEMDTKPFFGANFCLSSGGGTPW